MTVSASLATLPAEEKQGTIRNSLSERDYGFLWHQAEKSKKQRSIGHQASHLLWIQDQQHMQVHELSLKYS